MNFLEDLVAVPTEDMQIKVFDNLFDVILDVESQIFWNIWIEDIGDDWNDETIKERQFRKFFSFSKRFGVRIPGND